MNARNANTHYITEAADMALALALYVTANNNENNDIAQLTHDIILQTTKIISNDPQRHYLDPSRTITIEWAKDRK